MLCVVRHRSLRQADQFREVSYRMWASECDREASIMRSPWPWHFLLYDLLQTPTFASLLDQIEFLRSCASLYVADIFSHTFIGAEKNTAPHILFFVILDSKGKMINYGPIDNNIKPRILEHKLRHKKTITKYILVRNM